MTDRTKIIERAQINLLSKTRSTYGNVLTAGYRLVSNEGSYNSQSTFISFIPPSPDS